MFLLFDTLVSLRPETRDVAARVSGRTQVSSKNLIWNGSVGSLAGVTYLLSLHSADEPHYGRNSCPLLRSCFIGSCHVGVSKRFSRNISLAVYCHYTFFGGLIRSLADCRFYVGSVS